MARTPRQRVKNLQAKNAQLSARVKRQAAANRQASKAIYDPNATLSGKALQSAATQITNASLAPKLSAIDQQAGTTTTQGTALADRAKSYAQGVAKESKAATAHQEALGQMLSSAQQQTGARAQAAFDTAGAQEAARTAADTSLRGAGLGGGGGDAVGAEIAAGRGIATNTQAAAEASGNAQSANYAGLVGTLGEARAMRGDENYNQLLNRLANKQAELATQRSTTEATRGDEYTKNLLSLRQTGFENQAASLTLGLDAKKAELAAAQDAATVKEAAAKRRSTARAQKRADAIRVQTNAADNATSMRNTDVTTQTSAANTQARIDAAAKTKKQKREKETAAAVTLKRSVGNAAADATSLAKQLPNASPAEVRDYVAKKLKANAVKQGWVLPNDVLSAALDLGLDGHVSQRNIDRLKQVGVRIPSNWLLNVSGATAHPRG
jgi:hypothetical protein